MPFQKMVPDCLIKWRIVSLVSGVEESNFKRHLQQCMGLFGAQNLKGTLRKKWLILVGYPEETLEILLILEGYPDTR